MVGAVGREMLRNLAAEKNLRVNLMPSALSTMFTNLPLLFPLGCRDFWRPFDCVDSRRLSRLFLTEPCRKN